MSLLYPASETVAVAAVQPVPLEENVGCASTPSAMNTSNGASVVLFGSVNVTVGGVV